jgi:hypothetical protein
MKKIITQTTCIVAFFNNSHYWGGQLNDEAKKQNIRRKLKQNCESRFYVLILHCLSVLDYQWAMHSQTLEIGTDSSS